MNIKHLLETDFRTCTIHWLYTRTTEDNRFGVCDVFQGKVSRVDGGSIQVQAVRKPPRKGYTFTLTIHPRQSALGVEFDDGDCSGPVENPEYFRDAPGKGVIITFSTDVEKAWVYLKA